MYWKFKHLTKQFLERDEVIHVALATILAGEHLLLLGVPGTAKSALARSLTCSIQNANYFEWLLTKFTTPEEIFGAISLSQLQQDKYTRITTNKLPEAHIVFLDEIFKSSRAILNSFLTIINERVYHNNGTKLNVPLISLIGASNEIPATEDLGALYDRFMCKFWINYVSDANFRNLLTLPTITNSPVISLQEIQHAQLETSAVKISSSTLDGIEDLRYSLAQESIYVSDRKWKQSLKLVKAKAWLDQRQTTEIEDIEILKHVVWSNPNQITKVAKIIATTTNPLAAMLLDLEDTALEVYQNAIKSSTPEAGAEANQKLKQVQKELTEIAQQNPQSTNKIKQLQLKVSNMNKKVIKEILGLEI
ncbi:MAG: AAA family ATPase [Candidatus Riesia sp.]|nr:AAA family ATPase [Candidatus Riesia sp.]